MKHYDRFQKLTYENLRNLSVQIYDKVPMNLGRS